ncbi:zinc-dependent alcohol dehydrogenase [Phycisphaera mikurensis]|uniref:Putative glutathione-dependent formaldehyde dehydrogenase n=1 Tax=Phycisphaera mikurensis (strain NBRC 102666 / KCTC 22515 / FYK2301M01) TaxID=1142394 RepID=I0IFP9_PHYMF|nr:zinc-dependent alcohol dehydrogenase [Phycisphaera mikurensis]MBB6440523.1 threonine dehydrogenase-like Zn-dependent dehydrogenase [Phycisphaera mikurensis]BAM04087.1 putative glutathione-dependent formaldehyde dehydrogenase [Phycisphaera mikurensis NBRC 102666]
MKAVTWHGRNDIRTTEVPDARIEDERDVVIRVTASGICGSDLHIMTGAAPAMRHGDVIGHEPMGVVEEVGSAVTRLAKGDRVVVPFTLACGRCFFCASTRFSLCDNTNPNAEMAQKQMGHTPSGMLGYTHMLGGYAGGQAEALRVPFADRTGPIKVPEDLSDDRVVLLSDIFPTGYMAAENCDIQEGETVAVWGCGPVAQFVMQSAWMLGAGRVIAIDRVPERLEMARTHGRAETIDFSQEDVYERLQEMTGGRGPDCCVDGVGAENHAGGLVADTLEDAKTALHLGSDRPNVLNEIIRCCRKGGKVSCPGVYFGKVDLAWGAAMNKGLQFKMGQTHVQRYLEPLMQKVVDGEIDPSFVITHHASLDEAPAAYDRFKNKTDGCIKVVLTP